MTRSEYYSKDVLQIRDKIIEHADDSGELRHMDAYRQQEFASAVMIAITTAIDSDEIMSAMVRMAEH